MWAYELSGQNRIFAVSESWDCFADSNDGSLAGSYHVIGRPIWGFVAGLTTKSFLNAAIFFPSAAHKHLLACFIVATARWNDGTLRCL